MQSEHNFTNGGIVCALSAPSGGGIANLALGGLIQCVEAATLGMPFEVWKTRMGRFRNESTIESFKNVYKYGGGIKAFWNGLGPKMVESASKGGILLFAKEGINDGLLITGVNPVLSGLLAGAGGGVAQVVVMGPCTYLVTAAVTGTGNVSTVTRISDTFKQKGIKGFYPGGTAIAFRQATNWASRQGFTEFVREQFKVIFHDGRKDAKLTKVQEVGSGMIGGALSCWNHPFEVARIEMQARASAGQEAITMMQCFKNVLAEQGVPGLFKGIVPRIGLGVWQTLFLVTGARMLKDALRENGIMT